ncbi:MAG: hypothetical protein WKG01_06540 [Kofleriaceae bacterium]
MLRANGGPVLRGANAVVAIDETWWATRIDDRTWRRSLPSQCVVWRDGRVDGTADTEPLMLEMRGELANARSIDRRDSDDHLAIEGRPIIVRAATRQFHLLTTDTDEPWARALIPTLSTQPWTYRSELQRRIDRDGAPLRAVLTVNVTHANRALIKAGFNFVAFVLGAEIARLPIFEPMRRVVLNDAPTSGCIIDGAELRRSAGLPATAEDVDAVGTGIFGLDPSRAAALGKELLHADGHSVVLGAGPHGVFVFISLLGCPIAHVQILPRLPGFNIQGICAAWVVRSGEPPVLAPGEQLDALRTLMRIWAQQLPIEAAPELTFARSEPQPFVIEARYAPASSSDNATAE